VRDVTASICGPDVRFAKVFADVSTKDPGGAQMLSGEMARYQISDRVREAEADRRARSTRRSKAMESRGITRRIGRAALAAATWPIKH
jgi:hypothetical protein